MSSVQDQNKRWLAAKLQAKGRGARAALAEHLGVRPDVITRMTNLSGRKEERRITLEELVAISEFFNEAAPIMTSDLSSEDVANALTSRAPQESSRQGVPLVAWVSAGKLADVDQEIPVRKFLEVGMPDLGRGDFFATRVEGDSMDRVSPDGSIIVVNRRERQLISGRHYIFAIRGKTTFKTYRDGDPPYLAPYSTNPVNQPIIVKRKSDVEVVGRVRWTFMEL